MGNPGDVFHIKGIADEDHSHADVEQRLTLLDAKLRELRAEWDEFIEAVGAQADARERPDPCPTCAKPKGEDCVTASGKRAAWPHAARDPLLPARS